MGKSLKNAVTPDEVYRDYGADTLRLYEMSTGPLDASRPWSTTDIIGVHRFLQRLWRNIIDEDTGETRVTSTPAADDTRKLLHRTIASVRDDMTGLKFNTAVARLIELNNHLTQAGERNGPPVEVVEPLVLMVAPPAPHVAEELWQRLGHRQSLAYEPFPVADGAHLVDETVEIPVQINGKVRGHVKVAADASDADMEAAARAEPHIAELLVGATVKRVIVVPGRLVNLVVAP
jgi:leucyl-tRNA synthetase